MDEHRSHLIDFISKWIETHYKKMFSFIPRGQILIYIWSGSNICIYYKYAFYQLVFFVISLFTINYYWMHSGDCS